MEKLSFSSTWNSTPSSSTGRRSRQPAMKIGFILRGRNGHMLSYRIRERLTQKAAAARCGIGYCEWNAFEVLRFNRLSARRAEMIADMIGCQPIDILPQEFMRQNLNLTAVCFRDLELKQLGAIRSMPLLEDSSRVLEDLDQRTALNSVLATLTYREREILRMRFG